MTRVTGTKPDAIGDVPSFTITYTPPANAPSATPSSVTGSMVKPDGTRVTGTPATGGGLVWTWTAGTAIDQPGTWWFREIASGQLVDASEWAITIDRSPFT
jgi:hypothetical protein